MREHHLPMALKVVCPQDGCDYIAYGDDEKQVKRDLLYHLLDRHDMNYIPEEAQIEEDLPKR